MKIVQVITKSEPIGGAQMVLFNIVSKLCEKHEVHVILGEKGRLYDDLLNLGVNCSIIGSLKREVSFKYDIKAYRELKSILIELDPDIVASHSSKAGYLVRLVCHKLKIPNVFTAHGWAFTSGVAFKKRIIYLFLEKLIGYISDHVITVSDYDRKIALNNGIIHEDRIKTIHNGAPDLKIDIGNKPSKELRGVMVARFQNQKDHKTLFMALKEISDSEIHIDLIGDGPLENHYKGMASDLGINHLVTFHGSRNDVPVFLNQADFFLLISNYEGLPLSICEAMSCSLPVIASNVGGVNEMVEDDKNGYLIPRSDYKLLIQRLNEILKNPKRISEFSIAARKTYEKKFTISQMVKNTELFYNEIINNEKN